MCICCSISVFANLALGVNPPNTEFNVRVFELSLARAETNRSKMFLVNFAHFLEKAFTIDTKFLEVCRHTYKNRILTNISNLPTIAKTKEKHIREQLENKKNKEELPLDKIVWNESKIDSNMKNE